MLFPTYVLAGGQSSRFGSDKARANRSGQLQILWLAQRVQPVASSITVVAREAGQFADLDLRTIADRSAGLGPLGGLDAALGDFTTMRQSDLWFLLISCDLAAFEPRWVELLAAARAGGSPAVAFRHQRWEPLLALYQASIAEHIARCIERKELSLWRLLESIGATAVQTPADWPVVSQFNSPQEFAELKQRGDAPSQANRP